MLMQTTRINKMYGPQAGDTVLYQEANKWDIRFRFQVSLVLWPEYYWEYKEVRAAANVAEFLRCVAEGRAYIPLDMDGPYSNSQCNDQCKCLDLTCCYECNDHACKQYMLG